MRLRYKMLLAFFGSLAISVTIFLFFSYYILKSGYYSGVSAEDMRQALNYGREMILGGEDVQNVLDDLQTQYENMDFALLGDTLWLEGGDVPDILDEPALLDAINGQNEDCSGYEVRAVAASKEEGTLLYLLCYVGKENYEALSYEFNMIRAEGMLGKMAIIGVLVTAFIAGGAIHLVQREYEEKERYEKSRKQLISNISHDLRTPLSSVMGYAEMVKNRIYEDEAERDRYVDIIYRKSVYMEKLLTELLEYSRLELGTIHINREKMDIAELTREILIEYYPEIERNHYQLELEIPGHKVVGNWDKAQIGRVIRNLMDNALKYGMDGGKLKITIQEKQRQVYMAIEDFGKGISEDEVMHVTEQFYRADNSRNSKSGGMGLGLFIAQEIVKLHGGNFRVVSTEGKGTKMCIWLP